MILITVCQQYQPSSILVSNFTFKHIFTIFYFNWNQVISPFQAGQLLLKPNPEPGTQETRENLTNSRNDWDLNTQWPWCLQINPGAAHQGGCRPSKMAGKWEGWGGGKREESRPITTGDRPQATAHRLLFKGNAVERIPMSLEHLITRNGVASSNKEQENETFNKAK